MITWENYIGCKVEVTESDSTVTKGFIEAVKDDRFYIYSPEIGFAMPIIKKDVVGLKYTKPARKLTMEEWELYCMNVLGIHLGGVSVTRKGFAIKGWQLDGETIIPFDEEIDMLKIYKEERERNDSQRT